MLGFERRGGRTILTERRYTLPLQALEVTELEPGGAALMLLNPTGGVLGGDRLETRVRLGPGAQVCLTTPSATRVYRSAGEPAVQRWAAEVGAGARLEYIPDHLIPSPGARLTQSTEIALGAGAAALVWDAWSVGRPARGETWAFDELDLGLTIRDTRGPILHERARLCGEPRWSGLGGLEGLAYVGTLAVALDGPADWDAVAGALAARVGSADGVRVGVSPLGRSGLVARVLAASAPRLVDATTRLWGETRQLLFGLPPLALRKL